MDEYDDFLLNSRFVIQHVLIPIICIIGIPVNSVTILVFSQHRLRCSTNIYLRALAVFDLIYLTSVLILSFYHYSHHPNFLYCKPYALFISDFSSNTAVYLTAAFTMERFYVVSKNLMKNLKYATAQFANRISVLLAFVCFFCTLSTLFEQRVVQAYNNQTETFSLRMQATALGKNSGYILFINTFSAIFFVLLPFVTIASLNVFLIYALRKARKIRSSLLPASASELRTTSLLVVLVLMFLLCQGPAATFMIASQFVELNDNLQRGLGNIFNLLLAVNACGNFFLYVSLSEKFRTTFMELLFSGISAKLLPRFLRVRQADAGYAGSHYHHPTLNPFQRVLTPLYQGHRTDTLLPKKRMKRKAKKLACIIDDDSLLRTSEV